jgi:DNA-directed RNA polymerase III subunit RPC6
MNPIKSEPMDTQSSSKTETFQQELVTTNGKSTLITTSKQLTTLTSTDPTDIEKHIYELCKQHPEGITDQILQNGMPNISSQQRLAALNRLLSLNKIDLIKSSQSGLLYRLKDLEAVMKGSYDVDEKLIYSIIKESGNKGIWVRDITVKTNLKATVLNKILKGLESKKLIKAVTSVNASKKKVYMLFDLEPDRSLTGGSWYNGKEFESEFVEILNEQCYLYLLSKKSKASKTFLATKKSTIIDPIAVRNASYATTKEITDYIRNLGISRVELSLDDIECVLNTLVFDGKIERTVMHSTATLSKTTASNNEHVSLFRAVNSIIPVFNVNDDDDEEEGMDDDKNDNLVLNDNNKKKIVKSKGYGSSLVRVPCGICPVIDDCYDDGPISPKTCIYMKEWLEF